MVYVEVLEEILENDYARRQAERKLLTTNELTITEVVNPCHLQVYFNRYIDLSRLVGRYPEIAPEVIRSMHYLEHGSILHDLFTERISLKYAGKFAVKQELRYKLDDLIIIGHPDIVNIDHEAVVELKTVSPRSFNFIKNISKEPNIDHKLQLEAYMYMLKKIYPIPFTGYIDYICKARSVYGKKNIVNDFDMLEFMIDKYDEEDIKFLEEKARMLHKQLVAVYKSSIYTYPNYRLADGVAETTEKTYNKKYGAKGNSPRERYNLWKCEFCVFKPICPYYGEYVKKGWIKE